MFQANWLGAIDHYKAKLSLSDTSAKLLYEFLLCFADDVNSYIRCHSTAFVERLHNLVNKYVSKQVHYGFKCYYAHKALVVLD